MSGHRQAAVALHGLAAADRGLILDQLGPADQATLRAYLDELQALGFEQDGAAGLAQAGAALPADLDSATAATMFGLLEHEPAALVAEVLAMQSWRWSAGLLALYSPARRQAITALRMPAAPARARCVRASLNARLAQSAPAPLPQGPLVSLWRRISAWRP